MMVGKFFLRGRKILSSPQSTILSAASVIMVMVVMSRVLGLVRQRVLLSFFVPEELSLFFAAFRLPDLVFEVLTLGSLSSAFIPVFTKLLKKDEGDAWDTAGRVVSIGLAIFVLISLVFGFLAVDLYAVVAPGYSHDETVRIANIARVLFAAQGFFVMSYVLTGVLESMKMFLVPALAPLFYNVGIIVGTALFASRLGLWAPVLGVLIGSTAHFAVQLPLAYRMGFRFKFSLKPNDDVKKIGRLAGPRMFELSVLQVSKTVELYLASIISTASYTYYMLANSVQLLPVGLFGLSLAKAALPTLTRQSDDLVLFRRTLLKTLNLVMFLVMPLAVFLIVLRVPVVRLLFGTSIFDWPATVQTGLVLSAFAVGIPAQATAMLLNRAFYALHDTKTPVKVSLFSTMVMITGGLLLVLYFKYPTWALAVSYTAGVLFQAAALYVILCRRVDGNWRRDFRPMGRSIFAASVAGVVMYFMLKFFDRSVWVKRLSFLIDIDKVRNLNFEAFVLDTRYTTNLMILTIVTALVGGLIYIGINLVMRSEELATIANVIKRRGFAVPQTRETETVSPRPGDSGEV